MVTFVTQKHKLVRGRIEWVLQENQQEASTFPLSPVFVLSYLKLLAK